MYLSVKMLKTLKKNYAVISHLLHLGTICDYLSLANSTLLTADTILCLHKILSPIDYFRFLFHIQTYHPLLVLGLLWPT